MRERVTFGGIGEWNRSLSRRVHNRVEVDSERDDTNVSFILFRDPERETGSVGS